MASNSTTLVVSHPTKKKGQPDPTLIKNPERRKPQQQEEQKQQEQPKPEQKKQEQKPQAPKLQQQQKQQEQPKKQQEYQPKKQQEQPKQQQKQQEYQPKKQEQPKQEQKKQEQTPTQTLAQQIEKVHISNPASAHKAEPMQVDSTAKPKKAKKDKKRKSAESKPQLEAQEAKKPKVEAPKPAAASKQVELKPLPQRKVAEGGENHVTKEPFPSTLKCYKALSENWTFMTEVQAKTLPFSLAGKDVEAQAKTGSGKTLAFMLPAVEHAIANVDKGDVIVLVLSPGRELALQTLETSSRLLKYHPNVRAHLIIGGKKIESQKTMFTNKQIKKHIIVASPGRMLEHLELGHINLNNLKYFVLDEADSLLDPGSIVTIKKIEEFLPKDCQRALFTATITDRVKQRGDLKADAAVVSTVKEGDTKVNRQCVLEYSVVKPDSMLPTLLALLKTEQENKGCVIVFSETVKGASYLNEWAHVNGIKSEVYTSKLGQGKRTTVFTTFRDEGGIMFASDIVARGADFPLVNLVVQIGVPQNLDIFIHRIGRTGRMGAEGRAISLLLPFHVSIIASLKKKAVFPKQVDLPTIPIASLDLVDEAIRTNAFKRFIFFMSSNKITRPCLDSTIAVEEVKSLAYDMFGVRSHKCIHWALCRKLKAPPHIMEEFGADPATMPVIAKPTVKEAKAHEEKRAKIIEERKKRKQQKKADAAKYDKKAKKESTNVVL